MNLSSATPAGKQGCSACSVRRAGQQPSFAGSSPGKRDPCNSTRGQSFLIPLLCPLRLNVDYPSQTAVLGRSNVEIK